MKLLQSKHNNWTQIRNFANASESRNPNFPLLVDRMNVKTGGGGKRNIA